MKKFTTNIQKPFLATIIAALILTSCASAPAGAPAKKRNTQRRRGLFCDGGNEFYNLFFFLPLLPKIKHYFQKTIKGATGTFCFCLHLRKGVQGRRSQVPLLLPSLRKGRSEQKAPATGTLFLFSAVFGV
jgi:hypothetical protein